MLEEEPGGGVGAASEENGVAEGDLTCVAAQYVPGDAELRRHEHHDCGVAGRRGLDQERQQERGGRRHQQEEQPAAIAAHARPMRPCGRTRTTRRYSTRTRTSL